MAFRPWSLFEHHHLLILVLLGFLLQFPHDQYLLKLVLIYLITFRQLAIRQHLVSFPMVLVGLVFV